MKKERCYIAGAITGLTKEEAIQNFLAGKKQVEALGFEPVSPLDLPHAHPDVWEEYMKEDLNELLKCQHVYALTSWVNSRGAKIELQLALDLGLEIIYQPIQLFGAGLEPVAIGFQKEYAAPGNESFNWDEDF